MVKRYDRGGAGAGQVPLEDIRPPPVLRVSIEAQIFFMAF